MWQAVEASIGKIGMGKAEGRRSKWKKQEEGEKKRIRERSRKKRKRWK